MLFDDDEQLEVRHVVSLAHHDVCIYSGEETIPEGELYIKRNAICLSRKSDGLESGPDAQLSKPFYLFSENCSAKEDFYFALLRNQEQSYVAENRAPSPILFDIKNIISLVQKLHSSEEHMQTRWLNAMIGRMFLAVHKTKDTENFIREKLMKKIARVKRPAFLSNIVIRGIDTGNSAPYITNPRLRDLTVEGECGIEADMRYTGNFRLEVAATARIDLGSRFKVREVNLVLAVVIRKLEGHMLFKIKPPPSNRIWLCFQQTPKMEMTIEPIVSSRQITYTVILRQIESRIKEVIAETLVYPFWDDLPFFNTEHKKWRGGIFHDDRIVSSVDLEAILAQEGETDEGDRLEDSQAIQESELSSMEKSHSVPNLEAKPSIGLFGRRMSGRGKTDLTPSPSTSSSSIEIRGDNKVDMNPDTRPETATPRSAQSASFVQPPIPLVKTDTTNADVFTASSPPKDGQVSATAALSAKSQASIPSQTPLTPAFKPYITSKSGQSSSSSQENLEPEQDLEATPQARRNTASSTGSHDDSGAKSPSLLSTRGSLKSQTGSITRGLFGRREMTSTPPMPGSPANSETQKKTALAAASNAVASAKQWGLNALQRHAKGALMKDNQSTEGESSLDLNQPMGRGRPLPPPGTPLPMPDKKSKTAPIPAPKRKPVPPPDLPPAEVEHQPERRRPVPPPQLPARRQMQGQQPFPDNVLVVAAPVDSEPTTPLSESHSPVYIPPTLEDGEGGGETAAAHPNMRIEGVNSPGEDARETTDTSEPPAGDEDDYSAWMDNADADEPELNKDADPVKG